MAYAAGVDVGSTQSKAAIVDEEGNLVATALDDTGANVVQAAEKVYQQALHCVKKRSTM
jgi:activator of 2-hydroxyglutaryl-CoA dehydratase